VSRLVNSLIYCVTLRPLAKAGNTGSYHAIRGQDTADALPAAEAG